MTLVRKKPAVKKMAVKRPAPKPKPAVKAPARKPVVRRPGVAQANPTLAIYTEINFAGISRRFRGNLGVRNLGSFYLDNDIESFKFASPNKNATLVLFTDRNYRGDYKIYTGTTSVADLADDNLDNDVSSLILANFKIDDNDVKEIQRKRLPPGDFAEVLRIIRAGRARRLAAKRRKLGVKK